MRLHSTQASLLDRMIGAARLDLPTYAAIKSDPDALAQAALVVFAARGAVNALGGIALAFLAWALFAVIAWWLGRMRLAPRWAQPDLGQMLRLTGFATVPNLLNVLGFVPLLGWLILMIAAIWGLATAFTAVRVGLATTQGKALAVTFIAYLAQALLFALAANWLGIARGGLV
jgi:hypothetical protein